MPLEARASNNSRRARADPALYQGRRSRTIWPHSCPGGLTFPAPFQRNPTPLAVPPPTLAMAPLPSAETERSHCPDPGQTGD